MIPRPAEVPPGRPTKHRRPARFLAAALMAAAVHPGLAAAQSPPPTEDLSRRLEQVRRETRLLASPDLSAGERALIDYGGLLTLSYFSTDTAAGDNRGLRQYDLNLYARLNFDGAHEFYVRNRLQYRDYNPGDETPTDDDSLQSFLEEAYYKFDLARYLAAYKGQSSADTLTLTAGRQFVDWGSGLVLSQYLDGAKADASVGPVGVTLLGGVTPYGTTDFDASRPNFDKSTYRGYFGALVSYQVHPNHRPFGYVLVQRDFNKDRTVAFPGGSDVTFSYDSFYVGLGSTGSLSDHWRYSAEAVYQGGTSRSGPTPLLGATSTGTFQEDESIHAWAGQLTLDYYFNDPRRSRAGLALIAASGDPDRTATNTTVGGSPAGTDDLAFNSLGFVSAGYAFAPPTSNLLVAKVGASTFPFATTTGIPSRLQIGADFITYGKTHPNAPIDEVTSDGDRYLGAEISPYANWRVLEDVTVQVRYGIFFPGTAIEDAPQNQNPDPNKPRQFIYASFTYSF